MATGQANLGEEPSADIREMRLRENFERVMSEGLPRSMIILADIGTEKEGKVRAACVGNLSELSSLVIVGVPQVIQMLDHAADTINNKGKPPEGTVVN